MNHKLIITNVAWITGMTAFYLMAQGPLTPSGAPAPSMITLKQIEPRTEINSLGASDGISNFTIDQPGS